jgi:hypothetical protein
MVPAAFPINAIAPRVRAGPVFCQRRGRLENRAGK